MPEDDVTSSVHDRLLEEHIDVHDEHYQQFDEKSLEGASFNVIRKMLHEKSNYDIAMLLKNEWMFESCRVLWKLIDSNRQEEILKKIGNDGYEIAAITNKIPDNTNISGVLRSLPDKLYHELFLQMETRDRNRSKVVHESTADTVGQMIDINLITLRSDISVDVSLRYIRRQERLPSVLNILFVIDDDALIGYITLSTLLSSTLDQMINDIMSKIIMSVPMDMKLDEAKRLAVQNSCTCIPIVSETESLLGQVVFDNSGITLDRKDGKGETIFTPIRQSTLRRSIWLALNLATALIAASTSNVFEKTLEQIATVAVLMTIVPSMGGIAGTQTLSIIIRAQANGNVKNHYGWLIWKEIVVGIINGILWGYVLGLVVFIWHMDWYLSLIIAAAMFINMVIAAIFGTLIPLGMVKVGIDPALAGSMALTTMTDVGGLVSFLGLATLIFSK